MAECKVNTAKQVLAAQCIGVTETSCVGEIYVGGIENLVGWFLPHLLRLGVFGFGDPTDKGSRARSV